MNIGLCWLKLIPRQCFVQVNETISYKGNVQRLNQLLFTPGVELLFFGFVSGDQGLGSRSSGYV